MDINRVILLGRLTRDPNLSYTINGTALCKFSIAVQYKNKSSKSDSQETKSSSNENVSFFDIVVWEKLAENCHRYLKKSSQVAIEGYLKQSRYKVSNNENRYKIVIVAQNVQFIGERK